MIYFKSRNIESSHIPWKKSQPLKASRSTQDPHIGIYSSSALYPLTKQAIPFLYNQTAVLSDSDISPQPGVTGGSTAAGICC
jgi:hypothetical protein